MATTLDTVSTAPTSNTLGKRLQALRKQFGLSQRELARRADMTNSALSMVESGKVSPSVASLEKILRAIPVTLQEFFSESLELAPSIFRAENFVKISKDRSEYRIMPLTEARRDGVYLAEHIYQPGATICSEWMMRKGFVGGIVVTGILDLHLEGTLYQLFEGDGFHFSLHRSHNFSNSGEQPCKVVSVSFSD